MHDSSFPRLNRYVKFGVSQRLSIRGSHAVKIAAGLATVPSSIFNRLLRRKFRRALKNRVQSVGEERGNAAAAFVQRLSRPPRRLDRLAAALVRLAGLPIGLDSYGQRERKGYPADRRIVPSPRPAER